jgi:hypothetical protein
MKNWKNMFMGAAALAVCWSMGASRADASEILYDGVGFLQGTQSFTDSFSLSSPGTLTVTLANVSWPTQLASLDLLVSSPSGALGPELDATSSTATATYNVTSGNVVAQWFGTAQGSLNAGVYALEIQFSRPSNPVPSTHLHRTLLIRRRPVGLAAALARYLHRLVGLGRPAGRLISTRRE